MFLLLSASEDGEVHENNNVRGVDTNVFDKGSSIQASGVKEKTRGHVDSKQRLHT